MYIDSRQLDSKTPIETDVCVIGGGAAGITLALELAGRRLRVCVLESGGFFRDPQTHDLNAAVNVGRPYPVAATRLRYFGGTTNHGGGHCAPIRWLNFEERPWIGDAAWPLTRAELEPYYARAHRVLRLGEYAYGLDNTGRCGRLLRVRAPEPVCGRFLGVSKLRILESDADHRGDFTRRKFLELVPTILAAAPAFVGDLSRGGGAAWTQRTSRACSDRICRRHRVLPGSFRRRFRTR